MLGGGKLASLSDDTIKQLDLLLPSTWSRGNPVDIIGDAPVERYVETLQTLVADPGADAVLFMHAPTAIVSALEIANACVPLASGRSTGRPVLSCWLGGDHLTARDVSNPRGSELRHTQQVAGFHQLVNSGAIRSAHADPANRFRRRCYRFDTAPHHPAALEEKRAWLVDGTKTCCSDGIPVVQTRCVEHRRAARYAGDIVFSVGPQIVSPRSRTSPDFGASYWIGARWRGIRAAEAMTPARELAPTAS